MKRKPLIAFILLILSLFLLVACSSQEVQERDTADETVLTPPEQEGKLVGTWTAQADELTANQYFYGDGKLISVYQDPEEETWISLSYWTEENDQVSISDPKYYRYNEDSENWDDNPNVYITIESGKKTDDDTLVMTQVLPDGVSSDFTYTRGLADISIPAETEITSDINDFLIH